MRPTFAFLFFCRSKVNGHYEIRSQIIRPFFRYFQAKITCSGVVNHLDVIAGLPGSIRSQKNRAQGHLDVFLRNSRYKIDLDDYSNSMWFTLLSLRTGTWCTWAWPSAYRRLPFFSIMYWSLGLPRYFKIATGNLFSSQRSHGWRVVHFCWNVNNNTPHFRIDNAALPRFLPKIPCRRWGRHYYVTRHYRRQSWADTCRVYLFFPLEKWD